MSAAAPEGRTCVGVVYGGPSAEHEVSAASALAVIRGLRATRFRPVAIGIGRDGRWRLPPARAIEEAVAARAGGREHGGPKASRSSRAPGSPGGSGGFARTRWPAWRTRPAD